MPQMSGDNRRYLKPAVVLSEVMRTMEPNLQFNDVLPFVDSGGMPVVYGIRAAAASDSKKQTPRKLTASASFPEVEVSRISKATALTTAEGFAVRFDRDAMRLPSGVDMISNTLQDVGVWMAEYLNSEIYSVLDAGSTDAGISPVGVWSAGTAAPITDLIGFKNAMIREGYPYRMTDIYVESTNFNELESYLIGHELRAYQDAALNMGRDSITIPIEGRPTVHRCLNTVSNADIMGMDRVNRRAAAVYYHNDSQFGTPATISYQTVEGNSAVTKSVPNFGLTTHQYYDDAKHDTVVQVWCDFKPVVKDAYGIITDTGI